MMVGTPGVLLHFTGDVLAKATTDGDDLCSLARESFPENIIRLLRFSLTTSVEVYRSIPMFRPGMDAQVGFLYHHNPTYTLR